METTVSLPRSAQVTLMLLRLSTEPSWEIHVAAGEVDRRVLVTDIVGNFGS